MQDISYEQQIMMMITYASEGRKYSFMALRSAFEKEYGKMEEYLAKAEQSIKEGHKIQTHFLFDDCSQEKDGSEKNLSILLIHAMDQLMISESEKELIEELILGLKKGE